MLYVEGQTIILLQRSDRYRGMEQYHSVEADGKGCNLFLFSSNEYENYTFSFKVISTI